MTVVGTVAALGRYPVKSMQGEFPNEVEITAAGMAGDRLWGVVKTDSGHVMSGKKYGALLEASGHSDGDSVTITLPDGTTRTSTPAFTRGGHTLRLLSGSLAPGDQVRSVKSATFSIGAYRPNALPDPVDATTLTSRHRHGVRVHRAGRVLTVTAPRLPRGAWV